MKIVHTVVVAWCMALLMGAGARAAEAPPTAADPQLEARVLAVSAELRCLVCQNQTIADSHAGLAIDLREQVRQMLRRGDSEAQVIEFMTTRYGDFVLYRPPVRPSTWLLWFGPIVLLMAGVAAMLWHLRRRAALGDAAFEDDNENLQ
ncbi:MAG: cytochrome c-type biogenesis protein [Pseudomonadota bacterium]